MTNALLPCPCGCGFLVVSDTTIKCHGCGALAMSFGPRPCGLIEAWNALQTGAIQDAPAPPYFTVEIEGLI